MPVVTIRVWVCYAVWYKCGTDMGVVCDILSDQSQSKMVVLVQ